MPQQPSLLHSTYLAYERETLVVEPGALSAPLTT